MIGACRSWYNFSWCWGSMLPPSAEAGHVVFVRRKLPSADFQHPHSLEGSMIPWAYIHHFVVSLNLFDDLRVSSLREKPNGNKNPRKNPVGEKSWGKTSASGSKTQREEEEYYYRDPHLTLTESIIPIPFMYFSCLSCGRDLVRISATISFVGIWTSWIRPCWQDSQIK